MFNICMNDKMNINFLSFTIFHHSCFLLPQPFSVNMSVWYVSSPLKYLKNGQGVTAALQSFAIKCSLHSFLLRDTYVLIDTESI